MSFKCLNLIFGSVFQQLRGSIQEENKVQSKVMHFQEQQNFENRVACGICLEPRLRMVTGNCQHRFCIQCIYDGSNQQRKKGLERCPSCQMDSAFPLNKPVIPEDMIEIQRALGVGECDRCGEEIWVRELGDHQSECNQSPASNKKTSSRGSRTSPGSGSRERSDHRHKTPYKYACVAEVKRLLDDLEGGMKTRSRTSPRCLQELDGNGRAKRRQRSPPGKVKVQVASMTSATENRRQSPQSHPYRKK